MKDKKSSSAVKIIIQIAPLAMIGVFITIYFMFFRDVSVEHILEFTPDNLFVAALVIWGIFALKSMSLFFPMLIIIAATGTIFPNVFLAVLINTAGIIIQITIPYMIGRFAERDFVERLLNKNMKAGRLREIKSKNEWFLAYFLRVINILPCDLVSLFMGSTGFGYMKYYIGSVLGILPGMVATTVLGAKITDPSSPEFLIAASVEIVFSVTSFIVYRIYLKKQRTKASQLSIR